MFTTQLKKSAIGIGTAGILGAAMLGGAGMAYADDASTPPPPGAPIICKADPGVATACGGATLRAASKVGDVSNSPSGTLAQPAVVLNDGGAAALPKLKCPSVIDGTTGGAANMIDKTMFSC